MPKYLLYALKTFTEEQAKEFHENKIERIIDALASIIANCEVDSEDGNDIADIRDFLRKKIYGHLEKIELVNEENVHVSNYTSYYNTLGEAYRMVCGETKNENAMLYQVINIRDFLTSDELSEIFHINCHTFWVELLYSIPIAGWSPVGVCFNDFVRFLIVKRDNKNSECLLTDICQKFVDSIGYEYDIEFGVLKSRLEAVFDNQIIKSEEI